MRERFYRRLFVAPDMYVRDAKNREEVWLLDHIEAMGLDERAFRSRDYVIAIDEESGEKTGFGRIRIHREDGGICELTSIGVLDGWRNQGVGAHVVERLIEYAGDEDFETVYALAPEPDYLAQFGFEAMDDDAPPAALQSRLEAKREDHQDPVVPMSLPTGEFRMPPRLRERFKRAGQRQQADAEPETEAEAVAEELGIDPDQATYKYDTTGGRR